MGKDIQEDKGMLQEVDRKLRLLIGAFTGILYEDDDIFMEKMQGVGLYGIWKLFAASGEKEYLEILTRYYDRQQQVGFPQCNVNTVTPYLTMSYLAEYLQSEVYMKPCREAAEWVMYQMPRTREGGIQHMTSDDVNEQELWDDTLVMTVLFLANMAQQLHHCKIH